MLYLLEYNHKWSTYNTLWFEELNNDTLRVQIT